MSTAVDLDPGPSLGHGQNVVVVVSPDACQAVATPSWGGGDPVPTITTPTSSSTTGLVVTKLLTRPKTSSAAQRQSTTQYSYGSKCSKQVLGEKLANPQPQPQDRPKTSVQRRERERPGTSSKERVGYVAVQGKELPLPICTTRDVRAPGADKDILSITTKLRHRSAVGSRSIASLMGPTSRDRSAALLKELSLSFSMGTPADRLGPTSPFKDCLRERWSRDNTFYSAAGTGRDSGFYSANRDRPLSPVKSMSMSVQDGQKERCSTVSVDGSQCSDSKGADTERSKELKESWNRCSSPARDTGELTRRSTSPAKETSGRDGLAASARRVRSSGNLLNGVDLFRSPRKDKSGREVVITSPRIITINSIPSASTKKEPRRKTRGRAKPETKPVPLTTLSLQNKNPVPQSGEGNLSASPERYSIKERLDLSPKQGEAPGNVTTFEMAISPLKSSPRARAASLLSETGGQPVSVREDMALNLTGLYGQHHVSLVSSDSHANDRVNTARKELGKAVQEEQLQFLHKDGAGECITAVSLEGTTRISKDGVTRIPSEEIARAFRERSKQSPREVPDISPRESTRNITQEELTAIMKAKLEHDFDHKILMHTNGCQAEQTSLIDRNTSSDKLTRQRSDSIDDSSATSHSDSSSSTPTVPFSGPDLLCGNGEGAGRGPHPAAHGAGSDELAAGDVGAWDQRGGDKQKLKELDLHGNKRPTSRNSTNRKIPSFDKVSSEREELRPIGNSLPPAKQSPLRSNGVKNNLLRADQFISSRSNGTTGREDDLVAMGTLWSPSQLQTRGSCTTISSSKSTSAPNSGSYTVYGTLPARRPINLSTTSTSTRQLLHHTTASSTQITPNMGNGIRKEVEPKYGDPLSGAPPSFQSRLMELAALEAETARWERTKKVKKKPKADRDS
ncbi:serine-rich adhesin for platelets-like [Littorina saxatilis]|uniref:serine-rich adhesin for platelets-like n=1 Tax=Littorina saxatilis TaxID=31220 RepID=UPI0038B523EE